jgi:hypothetical protein
VSSEESSTGLGIHNRNWSHVKAIGLPVFEYPQFNKVAKEAKLLRHAADGAYEAQGYCTEEKTRKLKEYARRKRIADEGKEHGWFQNGDGERIDGHPCAVCHKILCTCEFAKEQEAMRRRGFEDPFERIKDRGILQPGQDFLPSSSTPSADIEFWNKVEFQAVNSQEVSEDGDLFGGDGAIKRVNPDTHSLVSVARNEVGVVKGLRDVLVNKTEAARKMKEKLILKEAAKKQKFEALGAAIAADIAAFPDSATDTSSNEEEGGQEDEDGRGPKEQEPTARARGREEGRRVEGRGQRERQWAEENGGKEEEGGAGKYSKVALSDVAKSSCGKLALSSCTARQGVKVALTSSTPRQTARKQHVKNSAATEEEAEEEEGEEEEYDDGLSEVELVEGELGWKRGMGAGRETIGRDQGGHGRGGGGKSTSLKAVLEATKATVTRNKSRCVSGLEQVRGVEEARQQTTRARQANRQTSRHQPKARAQQTKGELLEQLTSETTRDKNDVGRGGGVAGGVESVKKRNGGGAGAHMFTSLPLDLQFESSEDLEETRTRHRARYPASLSLARARARSLSLSL